VYQGEVADILGDPADGEIVDVVSSSGQFIARGYINRASQILVRLLTWRDEPIDDVWFGERLRSAVYYRDLVAPGAHSLRLVFGEADGLPGLIVDRYGDCLVFQTLTLGMECRKQMLVQKMLDLTGVSLAYERNDVRSRELEGLPQTRGFLSAQFDTTFEIRENDLCFLVDISEGQKTGYFLDQRENRKAIAPFVQGGRVLDCFCHTGSFAVHAARYGASEVVGIDISEPALEIARANARRNDCGRVCRFEAANVFDSLRAMSDSKDPEDRFDVVILDPPAFTKSRASVEGALRGYKEINLRACRLLKPGGFLITSSCSHHVDEPTFISTVESAVRDSGRRARLVEVRTQAKDHPILLGVPETRYLKFLILQIL
jgi:23S rRNA (cytosine1962-C5)-methyltransferase